MIEEKLLTRIITQVDLIKKEGFPCFSGSYSYPFKKSNLRIEICLSKAFSRVLGAGLEERFYQEVKISIPPHLKEKTLKQVDDLRESLVLYLKEAGFETKN